MQHSPHTDDVEGWVRNHHQTLLQAYATVRNNVERRQQWNQTSYNKHARTLPLLPGERVLLRNFRRRAKGKLAPQWLPTPFVVVGQPRKDQPVFSIRPETKEGPIRTIHRNNLRPCPGDQQATSHSEEGCSSESQYPNRRSLGQHHWPFTSPAPLTFAPQHQADPLEQHHRPSAPLASPHLAPQLQIDALNPRCEPVDLTIGISPPYAPVIQAHEAPGFDIDTLPPVERDPVMLPPVVTSHDPALELVAEIGNQDSRRYPLRATRGTKPARYKP